MDTLRKIWERPIIKRLGIVGAVIFLFFLTLVLTLPGIPGLNRNDSAKATQTAGLNGSPTPDESAGLTPTPIPVLLATRPQTELSMEPTLRELGMNGLTLKGLYASNSIWIPLPPNWRVENLLVNLHYSPSPILRAGRANLNILVNDQDVTSFNLSGEGEQTILFKIPVEYIDQGDGFSLSFRGYLRLTDVVCEETDNPGQWVKILDTTKFYIDARPNDLPPRLEDLSMLMAAQKDVEATLFLLPDSPDSQIFATAASVAARLGFDDGIKSPQVVTPRSLKETDLTKSNLVVIGLPEDIPLLDELADTLPAQLKEGQFITLDGVPAPKEHGIIQVMRSPWNKNRTLLIVSAGNETGLRLAGNAFASRKAFNTLTGAFQFVKEEKQLVNSFSTTPWKFTKTTLADFGYKENRELGGVGESEQIFHLRWPAGWTVDEGAQFHLSLTVSPVLEANSHIVVLINGEIIGVSPLDPDAISQSFNFDIPARTINQTLTGSQLRTMKLEIRAISILQVDECRTGNDVTAWIQIASDSYFTMLHSYSALPNLKTFPFPFINDKPIQPVVIVLPNEPTEQEIAAGLAVSKQLGDYALDDFDLRFLTASQLDQQTYSEAQIIVLGTTDRQPWVKEFLNTFSPVPEDGVYQAMNDENVGLIVEGVSPWNKDRMVLLISSQSNSGIEKGVNLLRELDSLKEPSTWMEFEIK